MQMILDYLKDIMKMKNNSRQKQKKGSVRITIKKIKKASKKAKLKAKAVKKKPAMKKAKMKKKAVKKIAVVKKNAMKEKKTEAKKIEAKKAIEEKPQEMQILRKTNLQAFKLAKKYGQKKIIKTLERKGLTGRGGAGFPTAKKWQFAINTQADAKYVICNADEGEPGTFKDKFIIKNNPETLIEGILIAAFTIEAKQAYIYLRGEYDYLKSGLQKTINDVVKKAKTDIKIDIVSGAGAYVCGEETAIIKSIEGYRGQPYIKPPFPPVSGLFGKPTVINNVETLANVPQALLFRNWDNELRLISLSGDVNKPGIYERPAGYKLSKLIQAANPQHPVKAVYFGCFGGCMPYKDIKLTPENVCGLSCVIGSYTLIVIDETQSVVDVALSISKFYHHESCGKCTPCREGNLRILGLLQKIKDGKANSEDLNTLEDLSKHIHMTALCGLGQTSTNHVLNALQFFKGEFEERLTDRKKIKKNNVTVKANTKRAVKKSSKKKRK